MDLVHPDPHPGADVAVAIQRHADRDLVVGRERPIAPQVTVNAGGAARHPHHSMVLRGTLE